MNKKNIPLKFDQKRDCWHLLRNDDNSIGVTNTNTKQIEKKKEIELKKFVSDLD